MNSGEKLKYLRRKAKRTLEEQSALLGVSLNSVYRWEHELTAPKKRTLHKIADVYNVPLSWLTQNDGLEGEEAPNGAEPVPENSLETQLLKIYRKLSDADKYKVLGYIERICVECMDKKAGETLKQHTFNSFTTT